MCARIGVATSSHTHSSLFHCSAWFPTIFEVLPDYSILPIVVLNQLTNALQNPKWIPSNFGL